MYSLIVMCGDPCKIKMSEIEIKLQVPLNKIRKRSAESHNLNQKERSRDGNGAN